MGANGPPGIQPRFTTIVGGHGGGARTSTPARVKFTSVEAIEDAEGDTHVLLLGTNTGKIHVYESREGDGEFRLDRIAIVPPFPSVKPNVERISYDSVSNLCAVALGDGTVFISPMKLKSNANAHGIALGRRMPGQASAIPRPNGAPQGPPPLIINGHLGSAVTQLAWLNRENCFHCFHVSSMGGPTGSDEDDYALRFLCSGDSTGRLLVTSVRSDQSDWQREHATYKARSRAAESELAQRHRSDNPGHDRERFLFQSFFWSGMKVCEWNFAAQDPEASSSSSSASSSLVPGQDESLDAIVQVFQTQSNCRNAEVAESSSHQYQQQQQQQQQQRTGSEKDEEASAGDAFHAQAGAPGVSWSIALVASTWKSTYLCWSQAHFAKRDRPFRVASHAFPLGTKPRLGFQGAAAIDQAALPALQAQLGHPQGLEPGAPDSPDEWLVCARPGKRLWVVDKQQRKVLVTIKVAKPKLPRDDDASPPPEQGTHPPEWLEQSEVDQLGMLFPLTEKVKDGHRPVTKFLLSYAGTSISFVDLSTCQIAKGFSVAAPKRLDDEGPSVGGDADAAAKRSRSESFLRFCVKHENVFLISPSANQVLKMDLRTMQLKPGAFEHRHKLSRASANQATPCQDQEKKRLSEPNLLNDLLSDLLSSQEKTSEVVAKDNADRTCLNVDEPKDSVPRLENENEPNATGTTPPVHQACDQARAEEADEHSIDNSMSSSSSSSSLADKPSAKTNLHHRPVQFSPKIHRRTKSQSKRKLRLAEISVPAKSPQQILQEQEREALDDGGLPEIDQLLSNLDLSMMNTPSASLEHQPPAALEEAKPAEEVALVDQNSDDSTDGCDDFDTEELASMVEMVRNGAAFEKWSCYVSDGNARKSFQRDLKTRFCTEDDDNRQDVRQLVRRYKNESLSALKEGLRTLDAYHVISPLLSWLYLTNKQESMGNRSRDDLVFNLLASICDQLSLHDLLVMDSDDEQSDPQETQTTEQQSASEPEEEVEELSTTEKLADIIISSSHSDMEGPSSTECSVDEILAAIPSSIWKTSFAESVNLCLSRLVEWEGEAGHVLSTICKVSWHLFGQQFTFELFDEIVESYDTTVLDCAMRDVHHTLIELGKEEKELKRKAKPSSSRMLSPPPLVFDSIFELEELLQSEQNKNQSSSGNAARLPDDRPVPVDQTGHWGISVKISGKQICKVCNTPILADKKTQDSRRGPSDVAVFSNGEVYHAHCCPGTRT